MPLINWGQKADTNLIKIHLDKIVNTSKPRNYRNIETLNEVAEYIRVNFSKYTDSVLFQEYQYQKDTFKNVIASFGVENDERIVIGAHYDVFGSLPGADDNATGVVGVLELARMIKTQQLTKRIDLVAYSLEEPPFFRTKYMGSYVHAKYLFENNIKVEGMICLEMIGYFDDEKYSQRYPLNFLKLIYGKKGDFITVVRKFSGGSFARKFNSKMRKNKQICIKSFQGPEKLTGIDFSDHLNYWKFGYSALMVTNTAFYRNGNYHKDSDLIETLNIKKMTAVIDAVFETVQKTATAKE